MCILIIIAHSKDIQGLIQSNYINKIHFITIWHEAYKKAFEKKLKNTGFSAVFTKRARILKRRKLTERSVLPKLFSFNNVIIGTSVYCLMISIGHIHNLKALKRVI